MKCKKLYRMTVLFLCAAVVQTSVPSQTLAVYAKTKEQEIPNAQEMISIRTAEDLERFSQGCISDIYSAGKVFNLTADIDVSGIDLDPIAIFCGTFEGNNHVISGYTMDGAGSDLGFFRFVEKDGAVKNLTIEGKIKPSGTGTHIGGIAGTNRGLIQNCQYRGELVGKEAVGGIAGRNEESGHIVNCKNAGKLLGTKKTGGIVGINEGSISGCINNGNINATAETVKEAEGEENGGMNLNFSMDLTQMVTDEVKITSTGGIAGVSEGLVENSTNNGLVGYPHVGYRTGGIVGYQRGCIDQCKNNSKVQGRKDTGGIAGLFEPYVEINYEKSTSGQLRTQVGGLIDLFSGLSDIARDADSDTLDNIEAVGDSLEEIKDSVGGYKKYYRNKNDEFIKDMEEALDIVEERIDMLKFEVDGDAYDAVNEMTEDIGHIYQILETLKNVPSWDLSGGVSQEDVENLLLEIGISREEIDATLSGVDLSDPAAVSAAILNLIREKTYGLAEHMGKQGDRITDAAKGALSEGATLADNFGKLGPEVKHVIHVAQNHAKDFRDDLYVTDEDLSSQMDELDVKVDVLKDRLRGANDDVIAQMDKIMDQMRLINHTSSDGLDRMEEKINDSGTQKELSDYYKDLSDTQDTAQGKGKITESINEGEIISDINGGGIVGMLNIELNAESDFEIEEKGNRSLYSNGNAYGTILNCKNGNEVTVQNDYAGGIVGRAELGAVIGCQNYGDVTTVDGDYAGGIAGKSGYLVRSGYALCNIRGNNYAGGIVGEGHEIRESSAMTSIISEEGEKFGAIAGDADGDIAGNYFVDDGIAAVNGLTYGNQASPVSYEELLEMEETPADFRHFKIRFLAEDQLIKEMTCGYGDSLKETVIPSPPEKDGILGTWDKTDFTDIRRNMIVRAVYGNWTTALSYGGDPAQVLVSAQFHPDAVLKCVKLDTQEIVPLAGYKIEKAYSYQIESASKEKNHIIKIHVLADGYRKKLQAAVIQDGRLLPVDSKKDGSYLVFEMEGGENGKFAVLTKNVDYRIFFAAAAILAIILLIILVKRSTFIKGIQQKFINKRKKTKDMGKEQV